MNALELLTLAPEQKIVKQAYPSYQYSGLWLNKYGEGEYKLWWNNGRLYEHSKWKDKDKDGIDKIWDERGELIYCRLFNQGEEVENFLKEP